MEQMAQMLGLYAGGLQQSLGSVVDRVGQSLEQSTQMMQAMNQMMEMALLQSIRVHTTFARDARELVVHVENKSQFLVAHGKITVAVDDASDATRKCVHEAVIENLEPTQLRTERASLEPLADLRLQGVVTVAIQSPGTGQWIHTDHPFRVTLVEQCTVELVSGNVDRQAWTSNEVEAVSLDLIRRLLQISPLDALVTMDAGYYRLNLKAGGDRPAQLALGVDRSACTMDSLPVVVVFAAVDCSRSQTLATQIADELRAASDEHR
ncbi:TPA: hypothetical protein N0F65_001821 [Lagenidium giganteum]|uniref:Uncharacterized protein n=1 Tax=Lagenidium giganteum TaxID=4803 RepID=A0AAV2Z1V1_9STRA|nr:TPA: hypothetical protein N0F65_001821 [Lagenidium giganteum]